LFGTDGVTAAVVLASLGADAVGANCSTGPDKMAEVIRAMAEAVTVPIIAKPNAGLPMLAQDGSTVYDMDAVTFGREMVLLAQSGASILGGCCGTSPDYIRELVKNTAHMLPAKSEHASYRYLTSERKTLRFGLDDNFIIVGERINPTGKKKLQEQLRENDLSMVLTFAEEQEACGAGVLDVNMGMSGIDEKAMMLQVLEEVAGVTNLPISIDSSHVEVLEAALRRYPGRALINSISLERVKFEKLLPIAKKYGAMFILLPLSDEGLPKSIEEKIHIIETITKRAFELGMTKEDIVVDGLVATVGANKRAAIETLETIRYCKERGLATICGLSNISFGLPERSFVNTAFLTMAIHEGLTMAIANPSQDLLVNCAMASDLLLNKEESDIRYINRMNEWKESRPEPVQTVKSSGEKKEKTSGKVENSVSQSDLTPEKAILQKVKEAVLKGNKRGIVEYTREALHTGLNPKQVLDEALLPGINEVGMLYDQGKYFLPQLIAGAEAMKLSIEYLEPLMMQEQGTEKLPTIIIATVKGDIHDIGKNLVALMLKNYGFEVIDLGKDVPKEVIVEEAMKRDASVIALSALMTTTMQEMRNVIAYAKEKGCTAKIIIGGAVITQDYADEIGADGYSKDAAEAVKLTQKILGL
ncbi:MAG: dihydropteroate synthase, partial [Lachnospiraceae bacterium]